MNILWIHHHSVCINPPACRRVWLEDVVLVSVLGLYLFLFLACTCSFVLLLRVFASSESRSPPPPKTSTTSSSSRSRSRSRSSTTSTSTSLVVPVANDIAYSITVVYSYSSQDAHGTDRLVLIWYAIHWWFKHALGTQAASDLRLCLRPFLSRAST